MTFDSNGSNRVETLSVDAGDAELRHPTTSFDRRGRPTTSVAWLWQGTDPAGARAISSTTTYDAAGNVLSTKDPLGRSSSQTYDSAERRLAATDAAGNRTEWTLDKMGNAISTTMVEQVAGGGPVTTSISTTFDALGRPTASSDPLGNATSTIYDARGNVRMAIDAEGHFTESIFDGLDRLTRTVRPEGISVDYGYDRQSRLTSYRDALGNTTRWTYDALHRKRTTTYPDQTHESLAYDGAGNATGVTDGAGNVIAQGFDGADRLTSRTVAPAAGFEGPTAETFGYDGLSRPTHQQIGSLATDSTYDSLGRTLSETTNGKTTTYLPDDAGNVIRTTYPSGAVVNRSVDPLNRPGSISSESGPLVTYGYRGPDLVATKGLGNGLLGAMTYDAARRPIVSAFAGGGFRPFEERLSWSPRSLKTAISRSDENGRGFVASYDGAGRLVTAAVASDPLGLAPNNTATNASALAAIPESFGFRYDAAENLLEQRPERYAISGTVSSPNDASGRNRPGSFDGQPLAWDGNGNLIQKGPLHLFWDYRNRLVRVTKDGVGELARYEYDSTNRLTKRTAQGHDEAWVWSGWQLIERYRDGQLAMRRIYGQSLDEVVRQESDLDGNGTLESVVVPVYDSIGNAVALTDAQGKPIERQDFTPYGGKTTTVDLTPPALEQLREAHDIEGSGPPIPDALLLEFSEEVLLDRVQQAIATGHLTLTDTETSEPLELTALQPVRDGKQRGRRLVLQPNPSHPPGINHGMLLHIDPEAVVDLFENRMATAYERAFPWLGAGHAMEDATPPRVELLLTKQGELGLQFSEEISPVVASGVILLDGQATPWELEADGYTLKPANALSATTHTLQIGPSLHDLAGNALAEPFSRTITTGGPDQIVYERQDPRLIATSTVDNLASFQGHIQDPATGFGYLRNRWLDPAMGRLLSVDPQGLEDSSSPYQFAGDDPFGVGDPFGEALYAFDGTWNDKRRMRNDTNVGKLHDAYDSPNKWYENGVGTTWFTRVPCGLFGCGGTRRIRSMFDKLERFWSQGDHRIDIIGFSRGAAEAREFANEIAKTGIKDPKTGMTVAAHPDIQFLGLFDTVASFGLPGNDVNLGYDLSIPPNVQVARQAVAGDELRQLFPLTALSHPACPSTPRLQERVFEGAHSDIGGGYQDDDSRSRLALSWMWSEMKRAGAPMRELTAAEASIWGAPLTIHKSYRSLMALDDWIAISVGRTLGLQAHRPIFYPKGCPK